MAEENGENTNLPAVRPEQSNPHAATVLVVLTGIISGSWLLVGAGALWHLSSVLGWRDVVRHGANSSAVGRHFSWRAGDMWEGLGDAILDLLGVDESEVATAVRQPTPRVVAEPRTTARATVTIEQPAELKTVAPEPTIPALLDELENEQAILVVGAKGSGKTTVLRWLLHGMTNAVVFDPHNAPSKWGKCHVIGGGRNYQAIEMNLCQIERFMDKRFKQMDSGEVVEGEFKPLWVCIDEGRSIMLKTASGGEVFKTLLTEARKVAINIILANHSSLVGALGLEGASDLKEGLALVHLREVNEVRSATIDKGDGAYAVRLPGAYLAARSAANRRRTSTNHPRTSSEPVRTTPKPPRTSTRKGQIAAWLREGQSMNWIYRQLGGTRSEVMAEIREVKQEIGLS